MLSADSPLFVLFLFLGAYGVFVTLLYMLWRWLYPGSGSYRQILGDEVARTQFDAQEFRERAILIDNVREINREKLKR